MTIQSILGFPLAPSVHAGSGDPAEPGKRIPSEDAGNRWNPHEGPSGAKHEGIPQGEKGKD